MVTYQKYQLENPILAPFIQGLWSLRSNNTFEAIDIIPDGYPEIMIPLKGKVTFQIGEQYFSDSEPFVVGQISKPSIFHIEANSFMICLKLYPYYLKSISPKGAKEIKNYCVPLEDLQPQLFEAISLFKNAILKDSSVPEALAKILPQLQKVFNNEINSILILDQQHKIQMLKSLNFDAAKLKPRFSNRYLQKLYESHIGLSPKKYFRVLRLKKASIQLSKNDFESLNALSADLGYYDSSHLHKDFKALSFKTPLQFYDAQKALHQQAAYLDQWDYS